MLLKEFFDLISSLHRIFQSENFSFSLSSENSLTWEVKYEKLYFRRSWNLLDKLRKSYSSVQEWNSHQEIVYLPQATENSRQFLLLRADICRKQSLGAPEKKLIR